MDEYLWKLDKILVSPKSLKKQSSNTTLRLTRVAVLKEQDESVSVESYRGFSYHCHSAVAFRSNQHDVHIAFTSLQVSYTGEALEVSSKLAIPPKIL